jgi:hypothetical protein
VTLAQQERRGLQVLREILVMLGPRDPREILEMLGQRAPPDLKASLEQPV